MSKFRQRSKFDPAAKHLLKKKHLVFEVAILKDKSKHLILRVKYYIIFIASVNINA